MPLMRCFVTHPKRSVAERCRVLAVVPTNLPEIVGIVVDRTPFHAVNPGWPDQPGDRGRILRDGRSVAVFDTVTGARAEGDAVLLDRDLLAHPERDRLATFPVHIVRDEDLRVADMREGADVLMLVDVAWREAHSAAHSAAHLVSLGLNAALDGRWTKEPPRDALGSGDFDRLAIASSRLDPRGSTDIWRLGKSLRRRGLAREAVLDHLAEITQAVVRTVERWIEEDAYITVDAGDGTLDAHRTWRCELPEGLATIPCGGTHVARTGLVPFDGLELTPTDDGDLAARTRIYGVTAGANVGGAR